MNISRESDYALRAIRAMYLNGKDERVEAKVIAEKENIPVRFLFKILRKLAEKNIVKSYRGVSGGYQLNISLDDITIKDIVEIIEGPIHINKCTEDSKECEFCDKGCKFHSEMLKIEEEINNMLSSKTLEEILEI